MGGLFDEGIFGKDMLSLGRGMIIIGFMNQKQFSLIVPVVILAGLAGCGGSGGQPADRNPVPTPASTQAQAPRSTAPAPTTPAQPETSIEYRNDQYGFSFSLPLSWKGYSILTQIWTGSPVDAPNGQKVSGPEILIRHPLWMAGNPRQDIPILVFTLAQWDLVQQEKLSLGAAPIGPSELGRNAKYVFGLPARYNFAFPTGFEEVDQIIQGKPLHAF
jgi:hypothetical protein